MNATSLPLQIVVRPARHLPPIFAGMMLLTLVLAITLSSAARVGSSSNQDHRLPDDPAELLRIDDGMRTFFASRVRRGAALDTKVDDIVEAILGEGGMHFAYEPYGVYEARETFRRRRGNCLAYSMLVVAVAREFGVPASFNEVIVHPAWNRSGGLVLMSRHINVRVASAGGDFELDLNLNDDLRIKRRSARVVDDKRAFAAAYGNAGVYRLAAGDRAEGLKLMEKATRLDPTYASAWSNLGGALALSDQLDRARICYERALAEERNAPAAISGLAQLHRKTGRIAEAEKLERIALRHRERNPYYLLHVARVEASSGNLDAARRHLKRAIRIKDDEPEFYELMAEVARGQGQESAAKRWLEKSKRDRS